MSTPIYDPQTWVNGESGNTPINDTRLAHIEDGIHNASLTANAAAALIPAIGVDVLGLLNTFVAPLSSVQSYREPTGPELTNALAGLGKMVTSTADATTLLAPLGFTIVTGVEAVSKRSFALAYSASPTDQRGWGFFLFDLSAPIDLVIEAPHPGSEQYTEQMAFAHWQKRRGGLLMVAGAHPAAAAGLADVALQTNNVFHGMAASYSSRKIAQVQWHGYADATAPGLAQVVSSGTGNAGAAVRRVSTELAAAGFAVGNAWDSSGSGTSLTAVTNVQGIDAAAKGAAWVSVENNLTTRGDTAARAKAVTAVYTADVEHLDTADGGYPARAGVDFPQPVGTANTVGTALAYARADHIHKERLPATSQPTDFGYVSWSADPAGISGSVTISAGVLYLWKLPIRTAGQVLTNLHTGVFVAGSGLTASQCFMAVFDSTSGSRLAITADLSGAFGSVGETTHALTVPPTIASAGFVYAGLLVNGTTPPQFARGAPNITGLGNSRLTASTKRIAQYGSAQTAMPSSLTLASMVNTASTPWMAVS